MASVCTLYRPCLCRVAPGPRYADSSTPARVLREVVLAPAVFNFFFLQNGGSEYGDLNHMVPVRLSIDLYVRCVRHEYDRALDRAFNSHVCTARPIDLRSPVAQVHDDSVASPLSFSSACRPEVASFSSAHRVWPLLDVPHGCHIHIILIRRCCA
jgi:hypothetical protein